MGVGKLIKTTSYPSSEIIAMHNLMQFNINSAGNLITDLSLFQKEN